MDEPRSTGRIGLFVLMLAFVALAQTLYFTYQERQIADCQTRVNATLIDTLEQRSVIANADRESMETLISEVSQAQSQEDVAAAFAGFEQRKIENEKLRNAFKLPDLEHACE